MSEAKIYVGNLSFDTTKQDLEQLYSQYGAIVDVKLIEDRESGRSRGFAFVTFVDSSSVEPAIAATNNVEFQGRSLKVSVARAEDKGGRSGGGGRHQNRRYGA